MDIYDDGGGLPATRLYHESEPLGRSICPILLDDEAVDNYRIIQLTSAHQFDSLQDSLDAQLDRIRDPSEVAVIMLTPRAEREMRVTRVGEGTELFGLQVAPQDLTGITIAFSRILDRWEATTGNVRICLRGVESLFSYHDGDLIFRFLNTVLATLLTEGAAVHMHLDPSSSDERTVTMINSLFDAVEPAAGTVRDSTSEGQSNSSSTGAAPDATGESPDEGMSTTDMTDEEMDAFLAERGLGVLMFTGDPPYAIPMSYGFDPDDGVAYLQLGMFEGSEKRQRLDASPAVSLVVTRYHRPDRWRSVIVDGSLRRLSEGEAVEGAALEAFGAAKLASVDVFNRDPGEAEFEWFVLEPTARSGRQSIGSV